MKNILTFDIEEYFQVENFKGQVDSASWSGFESRVKIGVDIILKILSDYNVKVTFFVLGWTAERHPELIKRIADQGHEIGSHGYKHELIYNETRDEFKSDVLKSIDILENISGKKIVSYRAPSFSITKNSLWALDVLLECGIQFDSSIFPIIHDRYGIHDADRFPHIICEKDGKLLKEFPISTFEYFGRHFPFSGGGYFRLLPTWLIVKMTRELNSLGFPIVIYLHPWEFDTEQPRIKTNIINSFRHYINIDKTEQKLRHLLNLIDVGPLYDYTIQLEGLRMKSVLGEVHTENEKNVSFVIPVYNEEESVAHLLEQVSGEAEKIGITYEIILVDDGSKDQTVEKMIELMDTYSDVRVIKLKKNFGQTPAMVAGFNEARGRIIITLDGDLQNDPKDIRKLLDKIYEGYDIVSGWRYYRKDKWLTRCLPSMIANNLISRVTGVHLHDYGCSLKAYRADVIKAINAYGDMHRFFPAVASLTGAKTVEVIVNHRPRKYGVSKYGLERTLKVIADLLTIHLLTKFSSRPMRLFGSLSAITFIIGMMLLINTCWRYFTCGAFHNVIAGVAILSFFLSVNFIMLGLICTLVVNKGKFKTTQLSVETANIF